jgi:hypothetical protein
MDLRARRRVRFFNILVRAGMNFTPRRYNFLRVDRNVWEDVREFYAEPPDLPAIESIALLTGLHHSRLKSATILGGWRGSCPLSVAHRPAV